MPLFIKNFLVSIFVSKIEDTLKKLKLDKYKYEIVVVIFPMIIVLGLVYFCENVNINILI